MHISAGLAKIGVRYRYLNIEAGGVDHPLLGRLEGSATPTAGLSIRWSTQKPEKRCHLVAAQRSILQFPDVAKRARIIAAPFVYLLAVPLQ